MTDLSVSRKISPYKPKHKVRFVTAASLFDGHDASINIMRRILQATGAEVIHLGHNRSVEEIVTAALQEDVQGIAVSSYQGGHVEYFKYMVDLLKRRGGEGIKVFGGGGGVIVPEEIRELHAYGVAHIYSVEDGRRMGLQGMINDMVAQCDVDLSKSAPDLKAVAAGDRRARLEIVVEHGRRHAHPRRDLSHRRGGDALLRKQRRGGVEEPLAQCAVGGDRPPPPLEAFFSFVHGAYIN